MTDSVISKTERVYILILGLIISAVNGANMIVVRWDQMHTSDLRIYDMAALSFFPFGRFLSLFIVIFLIFSKRYFVALTWTCICFIPFLYQFITAYRMIHNNGDILYTVPAFALIGMIANPLDYLSSFLTIILLIWLLSVVVRSFTVNAVAELR